MIKICNEGMYYHGGKLIPARETAAQGGREGTITYRILKAHNTSGSMDRLKVKSEKGKGTAVIMTKYLDIVSGI